MKKLIFLIIFLIMVSSVSAATVNVDVPFKFRYGSYNETHTYFELLNRVNDYPYRLFRWPNGSSEDNNWDFTYHFDSEEVCNDTGTGPGYDWNDGMYNMTENLRLMVDQCNTSHALVQNLTMEISLNEPLIADLGRCRGTNDGLINQTTLLTTEKQDLQNKVDMYLSYENLYTTCTGDLAAEKDRLKNYMLGGFAAGALVCYLFVGRKKEVEEVEEELE